MLHQMEEPPLPELPNKAEWGSSPPRCNLTLYLDLPALGDNCKVLLSKPSELPGGVRMLYLQTGYLSYTNIYGRWPLCCVYSVELRLNTMREK